MKATQAGNGEVPALRVPVTNATVSYSDSGTHFDIVRLPEEMRRPPG
jgi:hypothetical protein